MPVRCMAVSAHVDTVLPIRLAARIPRRSDLPVAKEVCGENAEFFDGLRTRSLVESILKLDNDPEYREQLRENGVAFSCDNYDWDEHVNRLLDIFENTIAAGRHRAA